MISGTGGGEQAADRGEHGLLERRPGELGAGDAQADEAVQLVVAFRAFRPERASESAVVPAEALIL
jgi:hypothetical protein